jgi:hypothetical protein
MRGRPYFPLLIFQFFTVGLATLSAAFVGCSAPHEPTYPVVGVVTVQGKTPGGGYVVFESVEPASGGRRFCARGVIGPQGRYCLTTFSPRDGAVAGKYRVAVFPEEDLVPDNHSPEAEKRRAAIVKIPPMHQTPETSNLVFEVKPAKNVLNIELR